MKCVDRLMKRAVIDRVFPGGVVLASRKGRTEFNEAYGRADLFSGEPAEKETVYDLASLTKPLATTLAVMVLVQESRLELDQPIETILPRFSDPRISQVTIRHLLCHSSGLPAYRPYFLHLRHLPVASRKKELEKRLMETVLEGVPGGQVIYSDLGFMILRWIVETVSGGMRLDHFVTERIYRPLGLAHLFFNDLNHPVLHEKVAATELCDWRNVLLKGQVHDDNTHFMGGVDGQAGLFGTAADVGRLISALISDYKGRGAGGAFFKKGLVRQFWTRQGPQGRALGFDMPAEKGASCGRFFPETAVGHLGFTGTSFWIDPEREIFIVLLTNRVHPSRSNIAIRKFRPVIHDAIMKQLIM